MREIHILFAVFFVPWLFLVALIDHKQRKLREYEFYNRTSSGAIGFETFQESEIHRNKWDYWNHALNPLRDTLGFIWIIIAALWYFLKL